MRASILVSMVVGICTAATADGRKEQSADLLNQARAEQRALAKQGAPTVSAADVGDADSFGRNVHFIGVGQTGVVAIEPDCTPDPSFPPGPDDRCAAIVSPAVQTSIVATDVGRIKLPAKASNSLLCHSVTSFPFWHFLNTSAVPAVAQFRYSFSFTIENEVLNDPALIDPTTGAPFGGKLEVGFSSITDDQTLQAGDQATRRNVTTRACIAGLVSKSGLIDTYGLSAALADDFFKKAMTIRMNITLRSRFADEATAFFGVRFYGD